MGHWVNTCDMHKYSDTLLIENFIDIFLQYWTNKVSINDSNNESEKKLQDIWYNLLEKTMLYGIIVLVLDYGNSPTIATCSQVYTDKNGIPVASQIQIKDINNFVNTFFVLNYKVFEDEIYRKELLKKVSYSSNKVYKGIFMQLNPSGKPSLCNLNAILQKIYCTSVVDDKNLELANVIFKGISQNKLTTEQSQNVGATITCDKRGVFLIQQNKDDEFARFENITADLTSPITNWPNIKDELDYYVQMFFKLSGIDFDTVYKARQNIVDSSRRLGISNSIEQIFVNWVKKFIIQYNDYYNCDVNYEINSISNLVEKVKTININETNE